MCEGMNVRNPDQAGAGWVPRLRDALTRGFLILNFGLAEEIGSCGAKARMRGADAGEGVTAITIKISTPVIYIVNTSLKSKYWKILIYM